MRAAVAKTDHCTPSGSATSRVIPVISMYSYAPDTDMHFNATKVNARLCIVPECNICHLEFLLKLILERRKFYLRSVVQKWKLRTYDRKFRSSLHDRSGHSHQVTLAPRVRRPG